MSPKDSRRALIRVLIDLTKRDYKAQYRGTYLGFVWTFLQPLLFIGVLYLVFSFGLRAQNTVDMPFSLYLVCGMICWSYFSGNLSSMSGSVRANAFLVKKVDLDLSILPLVKLLSALVPHGFLIVVAVGLAWMQDYPPSLMTIQVCYYLLCMLALLTGLGWVTSSTSVFVKDVGNVVTLAVQFGFWLTPVFWNIAMIPQAYQWIIKANPVYYLVSGYRDSIVLGVPFWERPQETAYFWCVTVVFLFVGSRVFRRLRPHFAEVI